ncbi:MAG: hypothetical protein NUW22_15685 [Acidobacteria bacterium]|nr:hypothetical protein [Acidobacteriota bacterium]
MTLLHPFRAIGRFFAGILTTPEPTRLDAGAARAFRGGFKSAEVRRDGSLVCSACQRVFASYNLFRGHVCKGR